MMHRHHFRLAAALLALALGACSPRASDRSAVQRGDEAFALGNFDEALAEYRLAIRQGADDPSVTARVAHTYALMSRVDDAGSYYLDAAARDPALVDQAVGDLMHLARRAWSTDDSFAMASAVETALELRPGVGVGAMALPLARHYFENGEYGRALPFYQKAMAEGSDSMPEIVFEVGVAHDEIGDCEHALVFFERFREMVRPWEQGEVDWYIGRCAFTLARQMRDRSHSASATRATRELEQALQLVNRTVEVGEPRNIQAQAWFEKGEILAEMGECEAAMEAYSQVRYADQAGSLIDRAQSRFDEIYFGRGLEHLRDGRCR
ncbi:MAG: tetratricopeptide repeat protein [Gemmatimonadetes bacterium]|nr:tetratricopeptide repeat protein [Gemmatimonadota bacterium]